MKRSVSIGYLIGAFLLLIGLNANAIQVMHFDGVNNYINIDNVTNDITAANISAEIRFKTEATPTLDRENILLSFHESNYENILRIGIATNGGIFINTGYTNEVRGFGFNDNHWHTLSLVTLSDGTIMAYVDGTKSFEFNLVPIDWSIAAKASIGQEYDGTTRTDFFDGYISEVRIWNKQLTYENINNQLCVSLIGTAPGLIGLYRFYNSTGTNTLLDVTPLNNHGTIYNTNIILDWENQSFNCLPTTSDLAQFSILGDAPYDMADKTDTFRSHIELNNNCSYADHLMHVGDIKAGYPACNNSWYDNAYNALSLSVKPTYLMIGDNEWNDCNAPGHQAGPDANAAITYWNSKFGTFNQDFRDEIYANKQANRDENIAFVQNSVLYLCVNLVGGTVHDASEWSARQTDNSNWIDANLSKYKNYVHACVIYAHAEPTVGGMMLAPLQADVNTFSKPVLWINGDTHAWLEQPSYMGTTNLRRVVVDDDWRTRGADVNSKGILQVVTTNDPVNPFYFERKAFEPTLTYGPNVTINSATSVTITWQTLQAVESVVRYGKATNPLGHRKDNMTPTTNHIIILNDLDNISDYTFEVGTRTTRLKGTSVANAHFTNIQSQEYIAPTPYGPMTIPVLTCPVTVDGSNSFFEDSYFISVSEFDYTTWTNIGGPIYQAWTPGEAPSNIDLGQLMNLQKGKYYMLQFAVGSDWDAEYHLFKYEGSTAVASVSNINSYVTANATPYGNIQVPKVCSSVRIDGSESRCEDSYWISVSQFNPQTWTNIGSPQYQGWQVGQAPSNINLNNSPYNVNFINNQYYMVQFAVGPDWDAEYLLVKYQKICKLSPVKDVKFKLAPNPTSGPVKLIFPKAGEQIYSVRIFDLKGVERVRKDKMSGTVNVIEEVEKLAPGVYQVVLTTKDAVVTEKLVKQ